MNRSQRWRERRQVWVPNASEINPAEFAVDGLPTAAAKAFVEANHYSGTFPAERLSAGLWRGRQLVGVATFSVPMNQAVVKARLGLGDPLEGADLGRFVLLDDVAGNGETWFLKRALKLLRREKPRIQAVVSYADPQPRISPTGEVIKPGHIGTIYKSMSAVYAGRARRRTEFVTPDGQPINERAICKLRTREQGHAYVVDELRRRGAWPPANDDLATWFGQLVDSGFVGRRQHPGNHVYRFPLTLAGRLAGRDLPSLPYPKEAA